MLKSKLPFDIVVNFPFPWVADITKIAPLDVIKYCHGIRSVRNLIRSELNQTVDARGDIFSIGKMFPAFVLYDTNDPYIVGSTI